jgi:hypothetical protein
MICVAAAILSACSHTLLPIANGSHSQLEASPGSHSAVVWSNHPGVSSAVVEFLQHFKVTVVDQASLRASLGSTESSGASSEDQVTLITRAAKEAKVDWILVAEAEIQPVVSSGAHVNRYYGVASSNTLYHLAVSVRNVDLGSGQIRWSGTARYGGPVNNPEQGLISLTHAAISRAICPIERGFTWNDSSGCQKP